VKDKIGSLYEVLRTNSKPGLLFNVLFVTRRFIYGVTIVTLKRTQSLQIIFMHFQSLAIMIYLILAKPFYDPLLNHLEVINEVCILITEYHLIVFSDFLSGSASNSQAQDTAGYTMIAFTVINMVVNMGIMLWKTYHRVRLSLARLKLKYQAWKLRRAAKYALDSKMEVTDS
jgi:hypothetical protein